MFLSIRWEKCIGHVSGTYTFVNSVEWSQHYFRFVQSHVHITHSAKSSSEMDNSAIIAKSSISLDDMSNLRCCHCLSRNTEMHCNQQQMTMRCSTGISHMEDSPTSRSSPWIPSGSATTKTFDTATSSTGCSSRTHSPDCTICAHGSQGTKNSGTK